MNNTDWRAEFPILQRKNYLNSCSLGALSNSALQRVSRFHEDWHEYGASAWYEIWMSRIGELRGRVAGMIGAQPQEIGLAASISAALASITSALDYRGRNRVIVSELDFPTLPYAFLSKPGVEVVRVPSDDGFTIDPARFADVVDERTALIATNRVFYTTGAIQPVAQLADIAHRHGALLLVDDYQGVGQVPIDVRASDIDIWLGGPLKWLLGGPGLAYIYVRNELVPRLRPTVTGWFAARDQFAFDNSHFEPHDDARRFELGTPSLPTVHSALGGQELIDRVTVPAIREHNRDLTNRLLAGLLDAGIAVRGPATPDDRRSAIVMIAHDQPKRTVELLAERNIIVDHRPGYVRVSPHFYNTGQDVDHFLAALAEVSA